MRYQAQNKEIALQLLYGRLLAVAEQQRAAEIKEIRGDVVQVRATHTFIFVHAD
jgi:hypothetical protein